jgi:DNA polymerase-4
MTNSTSIGNTILHVDMDAFYASVEQRENPSLVGKPVVVGGSADGRGVVAAASYEARAYGIHSAMSARRAKQLCPHAVFIKPRIDFYADVSKQIRHIFEQFSPLVEPISLDEAFLDVSGTEKLLGPALSIGRDIKRQIRNQLGLVASVGIAPNKFLAKIASDLEKPDALVVVAPDRIQSFLDPLPVGRIWGVGKVSVESLRRISITTIGQLRQLPKETLIQLFGASGEHYWLLAQGIDQRRVVPDREAKSISSETTFAEDIVELDSLNAWLITLVEQVSRRLRNHSLKGRTVELKVRFSDFKSLTRSMTLEQSSDITAELLQAAQELLEKRIPEKHLPVRLLGFGVSNFDQSNMTQLVLFDEPAREQQRSLDIATDEIAKKFGKGAIHRAATPKSPKDRSIH